LSDAGPGDSHDGWSVLCSPLVVPSRVLGAITVSRAGVAQYEQDDIDLLNAISNQTASTIESARLYQESQRWADELAALLSATAVVSSSLELEEVLAGVAQHLTRL